MGSVGEFQGLGTNRAARPESSVQGRPAGMAGSATGFIRCRPGTAEYGCAGTVWPCPVRTTRLTASSDAYPYVGAVCSEQECCRSGTGHGIGRSRLSSRPGWYRDHQGSSRDAATLPPDSYHTRRESDAPRHAGRGGRPCDCLHDFQGCICFWQQKL